MSNMQYQCHNNNKLCDVFACFPAPVIFFAVAIGDPTTLLTLFQLYSFYKQQANPGLLLHFYVLNPLHNRTVIKIHTQICLVCFWF